jgi:Ca-activated chloride channel family protein
MPHRAAISGMEMRLGNRTVRGAIRTKEQAREDFEAAQEAGQQASLLDQHRPNVFSMELANILPGETSSHGR